MLEEDDKQYKGFLEDFKNLDSSDYTTAYVLAQEALIMADRWNEIMMDSAKYSKEFEMTKSDFTNYCYQRYKILMKSHEMCRMLYRQGAYGISSNFYNEVE